MSGAYALALTILRRSATALCGELSAEERAVQFGLLDEALKLLEQSASRRRVATIALAARIAQLERTLAGHSPTARQEIIQERLGISRATYYRLRSQSHSCETESQQNARA